jgi:thiol-disulfide isomerase/thioredoxin
MRILADCSIGSFSSWDTHGSYRPLVVDNEEMTSRRALHLFAAVGVIGLVLFAACGNGAQPRTGQSKAPVVVPSNPTALPRFTPAQFRELLVSLRGKPVVVNIWASWCGPCTLEAPGLAREANRTQGQVQFLGVDIIDHMPPARAFIRKYRWPYLSVFDPTGAIRDDLGFIGQPITVIYDASGKKAFTHSGAISEGDLRAAIDDVLAGTES